MTFNEESKVSTSRNNHVTLKAIIHVKFSLRHGIVLDGLFSWNPSCSYKPSGTRKLVMSNDLASSPPWVLLGEAILSRICWYLLPSFQTLWLNSDLICQCLIKIGEALTLLYQYTHIPHTRDLYLSVPPRLRRYITTYCSQLKHWVSLTFPSSGIRVYIWLPQLSSLVGWLDLFSMPYH